MTRTQRTSASAYFVWSTVAAITPPFSENSRYRGTPTVPQSSQDKGGLTNPPNPNSDSDSSSAPRARVVRRSVWRGRGGGLGGDCYRCGSCDVLLGAVGSEPPAAIATPPGRDRPVWLCGGLSCVWKRRAGRGQPRPAPRHIGSAAAASEAASEAASRRRRGSAVLQRSARRRRAG